MTLLIAGYTFDPALDYTFNFDEAGSAADSAPQPGTAAAIARRETEPSGIFVAADSTITSGTETLLSGFRKIYPVAVKLWQPYFVGDFFRDYLQVCMETEIVVGFAGSTLTAQHCMNGLAEHLSKLRISCKPSPHGSIEYVVLMDCEPNSLRDAGMRWGDDTFTSADAKGLLTAEYISNVILHSLKGSLSSARKYKISPSGFQTLLTPFVAGIRCPVTQRFHLYAFRMVPETAVEDGVRHVRVEKHVVPKDTVAVLGLTKEFEAGAQSAYTSARDTGNATEFAMFEFLNDAIDKVTGRGEKSIDRPAVLKVLDRNGLSITKRQ